MWGTYNVISGLLVRHFFVRLRLSVVAFALTALLYTCAEDIRPVEGGCGNCPGMVCIPAYGHSVQLGSSDVDAPVDELPVTRCTFSHDFMIDTVEVTVGMYDSLMGRLPHEYDTSVTIDRSLPVVYVSWYDAVLFCNARSRNDDLDSVYEYTAPETTATGMVTRFAGLKVNYSRNGYRLPTEAEWIYVAGGFREKKYAWGDQADPDSAALYAWYNATASFHLKSVALLRPNAFGLYDIEGNAAEIVNEDLELLPGGAIGDAVGTCRSSTRPKIIKGGCCKHDLRYLQLSRRSDVYSFDAASRNQYVGFRCVSGVISHPESVVAANGTNAQSAVTLLPINVLGRFGTRHVKLVFVNHSGGRRRLNCVDYSSVTRNVIEYEDDDTVYAPVISPDGRWVAWSSQDEGGSAGGHVRVRMLDSSDSSPVIMLPDSPACIPRWHIDSQNADTFIVYVTSAILNDNAGWRSEQTKMIRFSNGMFPQLPVTICEQGSYHGGLSSDGKWLATGYPQFRVKNLETGTEKVLFYAPLNGKPVPDTSQVCNVSIQPNGPPDSRMLFLDFGSGRTPSTLTSTEYLAHEYIFMGDCSGNVVRWYHAPAPYSTWDFPEYSSQPGFAAASATLENGEHGVVCAVNLTDSLYVSLCEGTDLCQPWLWIDPADTAGPVLFDPDSLGQYDTPHLANSQGILAYKMRLFWHYADSLDMVFVGSSVAADGIDPRYFTGRRALNMAVGFGDNTTTIDMIENYIFNHCSKVKLIALSYDMYYFFVEGASIELYPTFTKSMGYRYDQNHDYWKNGKPPRFDEFINAVALPQCGPPPSSIDSLGLIYCGCLGWGSEPPPVGYDTNVVFDATYQKNSEAFWNTIKHCNDRNIKVLLMTFPMQPGYRKTGSFGPMGPSRSAAARLIAEAEEYSATHPDFVFYDAGDTANYDYTSADFADFGHLCMNGAKRLSMRVDSIMHVMLGE